MEKTIYYLNHQQGDGNDIESLQDTISKLTRELSELEGDLEALTEKEDQQKADL